jgi:leucyl aminopeptidase (aminopeptidase T)
MTQATEASLGHGIDGADLRRYADLILRGGVNLEQGQKVLITGDVEHAYLIAALAERA